LSHGVETPPESSSSVTLTVMMIDVPEIGCHNM